MRKILTRKLISFSVPFCLIAAFGCRGPEAGSRLLASDLPLHLEGHLDSARIEIAPAPVPDVGGKYSEPGYGIATEAWGRNMRRVLYARAPGRIEYRASIPAQGRLDVGLGLFDLDIPVTFKITARAGKAEAESLLVETCGPEAARLQRSVDLSRLAGKTVTLVLETEAGQAGNVAFWASPTISGARATEKPNIVLYVIDGAAAEFMSVYGYSRRTTRYLERLASEGAVFENAYSNSSYTKVSVPSFMTSLHSSVLGGHRTMTDPLPVQAVPMAERLHKAGYITEVLTSNPYCGRMSGLERGVDVLMDTGWARERPSSEDLHKEFWRLKRSYPGEPFWVHFQPTDIHQPWFPRRPFAGMFAGRADREALDDMLDAVEWDSALSYEENIEKSGIDRARFFRIAKDLYDEAIVFQDRSIGELVDGLKREGSWQNTLFIVAADHSHVAAGLALYDPEPPPWEAPVLASHKSRIPLIFVWPGKIAAGRRFDQPVSMIDLLPTILDLAGLPPAKPAQGRSLASLLLGKRGWKPRPVVFDEFCGKGKYLYGSIEVIDGPWGASLRIDPRPDGMKNAKDLARPAPLLIFDIEKDPHALRSLHAERPDLVEKYSKMLGRLWKEHLDLAGKFSRPDAAQMTPEQIEVLRSLGYIR
jgi:arylsulfatase A-like enzyme